jgi:pimeloyl-ACP methyl ester carboxylesterase
MTSVPAVFVHGLIGPFSEPAALQALHPRPTSAPHLNGYGTLSGGFDEISTESQVASLLEHVDAVSRHEPVHLIAHSVGAVYAFTLAARYPEKVASIVNVEGNFSLADAFWSGSLAAMQADRAEMAIRASLASAEAWLGDCGVEATPVLIRRAEEALAYQPWSTVWDSARAIVETTGEPAYEQMLQDVFGRIPVHLLAGEHSASGWAVPDWAVAAAASSTVLPGVGHMMMLEQPEMFGAAVARILDGQSVLELPFLHTQDHRQPLH